MSSFKLRQIQLSRSYRGAVEETRAFSIDPLAVEKCRDCDNNQLKSSTDSLAIELKKISTSSLVSWTDLHGFNTRLELLFLEVLNTS